MRSFYKLVDLAQRRGKGESVDDLLWQASEGKFLLSFWLESENGCARAGVYEGDDGAPTPDFLDKDRFWYRGWASIRTEDLGPLLLGKKAIINRVVTIAGRTFRLMQPNIYLDGDRTVKDWTLHVLPSKPLEVGADELFVLAPEVERFEAGKQPALAANARKDIEGLKKIAERLKKNLGFGHPNTVREYWGAPGYGKGIPSFRELVIRKVRGKKTIYVLPAENIDKFDMWRPPAGKKKPKK